MRLLFCGDVVGRSGRDALGPYRAGLAPEPGFSISSWPMARTPPTASVLRQRYAKNSSLPGSTSSRSATIPGTSATLFRSSIPTLEFLRRRAIIRRGRRAKAPGIFTATRGRKVMVVQVMGRLFMDRWTTPSSPLTPNWLASAWAHGSCSDPRRALRGIERKDGAGPLCGWTDVAGCRQP